MVSSRVSSSTMLLPGLRSGGFGGCDRTTICLYYRPYTVVPAFVINRCTDDIKPAVEMNSQFHDDEHVVPAEL